MRKKRSLAMILIIAMVFCLMPVAFAGRAEAAESLVAYEAYKIYGIRDAADKETESKKIPIHRLYNPNAKGIYEAGSHHYTSNESEAVYLNSIGWRREGEGWYGSQEVIVFY